MDTITIKSLQYEALHGVYDSEWQRGNRFEVDLIIQTVLEQAGRQDDLSKTLDYSKAESVVREIMKGQSVKLIETLTQKIGEALIMKFEMIRHLTVKVRKINPPMQANCAFAEVEMSWPRSS